MGLSALVRRRCWSYLVLKIVAGGSVALTPSASVFARTRKSIAATNVPSCPPTMNPVGLHLQGSEQTVARLLQVMQEKERKCQISDMMTG